MSDIKEEMRLIEPKAVLLNGMFPRQVISFNKEDKTAGLVFPEDSCDREPHIYVPLSQIGLTAESLLRGQLI